MLIEITTGIVLTAAAYRCSMGESMFSATTGEVHSVAVCGSAESSLLHSQSVELALADDLATLHAVNSVFVERADGNLLVWVVADNPPREVREQIFQKQFDLIDAFPEVSFDFNIISTRAQNPAEIASGAKLIYSH